jgi:hypothetical protein
MTKQKARFFHQARRASVLRLALPAALVLAMAAGLPSYSVGALNPLSIADTVGQEGAPLAETPVPVAPEAAQAEPQYLPLSQLAEQYGIQITLIAVTAAGGLVDFRFKVLDPDKARKLVGEPPTMPALVAPGSGLNLMPAHNMMQAIHLKKNAVSYALYPNVRGAVKPGTPVSVAFNQLRVEPVTAQ